MGRVIGLDGQLKTIFNKRYSSVRMREKSFLVHRLVAETFMPQTNLELVVNHKDENKLNARLDNLEWVTYSENVIYSQQRN